MDAVSPVVFISVGSGMAIWHMLRRGIRWRLVMLLPAATVSLTGITLDWLSGDLSAGWVVAWLVMGSLIYGFWVLSWPFLRPVFERTFGTRW